MKRQPVVERGRGLPLILIPGIQGRWEWMEPLVSALAEHRRVLTFSLNEASGADLFDDWAERIDRLLEHADADRAPVVGISFGGIIAARYAARRPQAVERLILVSTPGPDWRLQGFSAACVRHPWLYFPLFAARGALRLAPETLAALPSWPQRGAFALSYGLRTLRYPASPAAMAAWVRTWMATSMAAEIGRISTPTLLITGEPDLDRVVPVASTLEYLALIPGAQHRTLGRTGHLGILTRTTEFARVVCDFIKE
ncbi:MAG: alpha/beta hydrolase [Vicinamibacterales bacterium]